MGDIERQPSPSRQPETEILDPHHFYAAYVFDRPNERDNDIETIIEQSQELGYPVRYWWLSNAMELQGFPDRLVVCVHHPSASENAGMDLYDALIEKKASWDELEAAVVDEYRYLGKPIKGLADFRSTYGNPLFPRAIPEEHITLHTRQTAGLLLVMKSSVREAAEEALGRELEEDEFNAIIAKFRKAIDWLDWKPYLDESIQQCQKVGLVGPAADHPPGCQCR